VTALEVVGLLVVIGLIGVIAWRFVPEKWRAAAGIVVVVLTAIAATLLNGRKQPQTKPAAPAPPSAGKKRLKEALVEAAVADIRAAEDAADTDDYDTLDGLLNDDIRR